MITDIKSFNERFMSEVAAAKFLGVCRATLKTYAFQGKVNYVKHPLTSYRCYDKAELLALFDNINEVKKKPL